MISELLWTSIHKNGWSFAGGLLAAFVYSKQRERMFKRRAEVG